MTELPFVVDGTVSAEKLAELLAAGTEYPELDFKRELDLSRGQHKHRVDFASDVAALASLPEGGYIVVGADSRGRIAGPQFTPPDPAQYDEAQLRDIVSSYVEGSIRLAVGLHMIDGRQVAVVFVGPAADALPPVMKRDGSFPLTSGEPRTVFRAGDVYVREGTSSVRMQHRHWPLLLANYRSRVRAEAAADTQDVVGRLADLLRGGGAAPSVVDVAMAPVDFERAVAAAIAADDIAAVHRALHQTGPARRRWTDPERNDEVETALDRLLAAAAVAVQHDNRECFAMAIGLMFDLYKTALHDPNETPARPGHERQAAWLWRAIAARVLALLALIVRLRAWTFVSALVLRQIGPGDGSYTYHSWLRHAVTEASRQNLLLQRDGDPANGALVSFAREAVRRVPALRFDLADEEVDRPSLLPPDGEPDSLLDSLCQADFLWCVVVVTKVTGWGLRIDHEFYPSCSAFFATRTQPMADEIVTRGATRDALFGPGSDFYLSRAIAVVDEVAAHQQTHYIWSIQTPRVREWVTKNTIL
jgi:hypothetical protein